MPALDVQGVLGSAGTEPPPTLHQNPRAPIPTPTGCHQLWLELVHALPIPLSEFPQNSSSGAEALLCGSGSSPAASDRPKGSAAVLLPVRTEPAPSTLLPHATHCNPRPPCLSQNPGMEFAVGQVDYMQSAAADVTYTPTLVVYRRGRRVDEFYGATPQQIRDRMWLQSD